MFNMLRNLGGAIGIAVLQTFLTKREQFHSDILTSQVSLLGEAARAREYMTSRGITAETIAKFRLGYAPDNFNDMREQLGKPRDQR